VGHIVVTNQAELERAQHILRVAGGHLSTSRDFVATYMGAELEQEHFVRLIEELRAKAEAYIAYSEMEQEGVRDLSGLCDYFLNRLIATAWEGVEDQSIARWLSDHSIHTNHIDWLCKHFGVTLSQLFNPPKADTTQGVRVEETNGLSDEARADLARHQGMMQDLAGIPTTETVLMTADTEVFAPESNQPTMTEAERLRMVLAETEALLTIKAWEIHDSTREHEGLTALSADLKRRIEHAEGSTEQQG
jgi:hypothetical protein